MATGMKPAKDFVAAAPILDGTSTSTQEIVEFAWLTYDVRNQLPLDEYQEFVQPTTYMDITDESLQKYGISRSDLSDAESLQAVIQKFDRYAFETFISMNHSFCLVTMGSTKLRDVLHSEAALKGVNLQAHFEKYFNLFKEVSKAKKSLSAITKLGDAAGLCGVALAGRRDCGIDACRVAGEVLSKLTEDGYDFSAPLIVADEKSTSGPAKVYISSKMQMPGVPKSTSPFLRLRGLPWEVTEQDVYEFVRGITLDPIDGCHIVKNFQGRPTGEAYIKCASLEDASECLRRHKRSMGRRYIEVFQATEDEMRAGIKNSEQMLPPPSANADDGRYDGIVKMRGLPFHTTKLDIINFFAGLEVEENDITYINGVDGRPTGEVFIQFKNEQYAREALKKHGQKIQSRYMEIFRSSQAEVEDILKRAEGPHLTAGMIAGDLDAQVCVKLRGLPFNCTQRDIRNFFGEFAVKIVDNGVAIKYLRDNRPSGEGFAEFATPEDAERAMSKQRAPISNRYIELFRVPRADMMHAIQVERRFSSGFGERGGRAPFFGGRGGGRGRFERREYFGGRDGYGGRESYGGRGRGRGYDDYDRRYDRHYEPRYPPRGGGGGGGYDHYDRYDRRGYDSGYGNPPPAAAPAVPPAMGLGGGMDANAGLAGAANSYYNAAASSAAAAAAAAAAAQYGAARYPAGTGVDVSGYNALASAYGVGMQPQVSMIRVRGLPYRTSEHDLMNFFVGYNVVPESIVIAKGPDGRPSGEGWVGFATPDDAQRALRERQRQHLGNRYVELFLD